MGAVSISLEAPSAFNFSRTLTACATISGPMPSPGKTAIFMFYNPVDRERPDGRPGINNHSSKEPRGILFAPFLIGLDLVGLQQGQADIVQSIEQAVLASRIHLERERFARGCLYRLLVQIDGQGVALARAALAKQAIHDLRVEHV